MAAVVSLREFVGQMDMIDDEWHGYLNRQTGEFLTLSDDELREAEEADDEDDQAGLPEWQREMRSSAETLESDDWLPLPSKFDIHEYAIMQKFCLSIDDGTLREDLCDAIRGSGAFSRFKNMAHRHGLIDVWYQHREQAFQEIAVAWLEEHGIA